jgi:hypothetical protein
MPGSNIIDLQDYRAADPQRSSGDAASLPPNPMLPAAALVTMGFAFWSNAFLFPAYASLSILDAWSQSLDD